jgi:hypothetical protein
MRFYLRLSWCKYVSSRSLLNKATLRVVGIIKLCNLSIADGRYEFRQVIAISIQAIEADLGVFMP